MKKCAVFMLAMLGAASMQAALLVGNIAFTAFNADGDDDFAIVALTDILNETIYFTDNESDGAGGLVDTAEGALQWDTGLAVIPAGTIITFTDTDSALNPLFGASIGTLSMPDTTMNLSGTGDGILAFQGTDPQTPTTFLAGIENVAGAAGDLTGSGLTVGTTFLNFSAGASDDGGEYTGSRAGQGSFSAYLSLINNPANWTTDAADGELLLPHDTTSFTLAAVPEPATFSLSVLGLGFAALVRRRRR